jgi:hypothetical protein
MMTPKRGDRRELTSMELNLLDQKILPTARRWLREQPFLATHAISTLAHWDEPLIDDHGKAYNHEAPRMDAAQ